MRNEVRILSVATILSVLILTALSSGTSAQNGDQQKPANPCNPCSKTKPQNPCNPCSPKKPANPCNRCGPTTASTEVYQPAVEYGSWLKINQKPLLSEAHGGILVTTFANPTAQNAIEKKSNSFPEGSVLIKESYADNGDKPGAKGTIFGMEKTSDGWLWVTTDSSGHVTGKGNSAQMQMCSQCHSAAKTDSAFLRKQ